MPGFIIPLRDYIPPVRYDSTPWTRAQITYSPDNVQAYTVLSTVTLNPVDGNPEQPLTRNFTVTAPAQSGWLQLTWLDANNNQGVTDPIQFPAPQGQGSASPSVQSARYGVRRQIRDGVPMLDPDPQPYNMVRLENLSDQIPEAATPTQSQFQLRYADVTTQRYLNAQACPGTLVAYVDGSWSPTFPNVDVDQNGNFTLPTPPANQLLVTYGWQYLSDGDIDGFVDESRQWLREFSHVDQVPDGLVPALVSYASFKSLSSLASTTARLAQVHAGDSTVDWSALSKAWLADANAAYMQACAERTSYYTQGPEALDPTVASFGSVNIRPYTPIR